jgi:hypothetical protein
MIVYQLQQAHSLKLKKLIHIKINKSNKIQPSKYKILLLVKS